MNKLEQLINELCPNGVEYKALEKCCNILDNKRKPVTKSARQAGEYPYYGANGIQDYVSDYIFDGNFVLVGEDGSVLTKSGTPVVTWAEGKMWVNNHAHIIAETEGALLRYLFHYLQTVNITSLIHGNIPKLTGRDFKAIQIALPTLPVQEEIVRILDNFTELTAELKVELTARKQQYEYYRDRLLTFGDEVERKSLRECVLNTNNIKWSENQGVEFQYIDLSSVNRDDNKISETQSINSETAPSRAQQIILKDDVIFGSTRPMLKRYCLIDEKYHNQICSTGFCILRANQGIVLPKWIYFLISSTDFYRHIEKYQKGASYPAISDSEIKSYKVPIPPLSEQQRIVDILDRFDKLCNDISEGLPAEIKAREQQYEYYRDKLLTFNEKEVCENE